MAKQDKPPVRGFRETICPSCGEDTGITLNLADLDECKCDSCDAEFTIETVRAIMASWAPILAWIDQAPILED